MKKTFTILMVLMALFFTQCKPTPEGGDENSRKVRVCCEISMNDGGKSDFTNIMGDGNKVNWSDGWERVYLAIHGSNPQIIELKSYSEGNHPRLMFEGEAAKGLIVSGQEYEIWYFGHSQQLDSPYVSLSGDKSKLTGSIAKQSGRLSDLGYCHIAKTKVTATTENNEVKLNLKGTLENQVAIALLDLENVAEIYGDAIIGTEYALQYNGERYELKVTETNSGKIDVVSDDGISYVILLPNSKNECMLKHKKGSDTYAYTFYNKVKPNNIYYRMASDGVTAEPLSWKKIGSSAISNETFTVNGISFTMIAVEGGTFQMGNDDYANESPVHSVTLSDYYIGETEVTQELWTAVMGTNPSYHGGYPKRPVEQVSWNDCQTFINKLNLLTGKNFRLPTEAEWEYAARGGNKSHGYKYSGSNTIGNVAWYLGSTNTHDVKTKQANELGIYDMTGNVWEWCQDKHGSYSSDPQTNPTGPTSGSNRIVRGGSWKSNAEISRVTNRSNAGPGGKDTHTGLRLSL